MVGSGLGGLVAANILSRFGYKVIIFEQHYTAGGSTHVYKTKRFDFDVGIHYVGGQLDNPNSLLRIIFQWLSDSKLEWSRIDEVYDVAFNSSTGERLEFVGSHEANRGTLLNHFPTLNPRNLDEYYKRCKQARLIAQISFALKLLPPIFTSICWKFGFGWLYRRYCLGTTLDVMKSCGLSDDVIGAITYSWGDYAVVPSKSPFFIQALMETHYDGGAFFPKGGSRSVAKTLIAALQSRGGLVFTSSPVDTITTKKRWYGGYTATGVVVKGVNIRAKKCIVSNAGFIKTFGNKDTSHALVDPMTAGANQLAMIQRPNNEPSLAPSNSFFDLFIGLDGTDYELGLRGQNIWHLPNWDHDKNVEAFLSADGINHMLDHPFPLVFVSMESAKDPTFSERQPGKSSVTIIAPANACWFDKYRNTKQEHRGEEYEDMKDSVTKVLLDILYFHFPGTKGHVAFTSLGTPLSVNKYLGRISGEVYNLDLNTSRFETLNSHLALHPETTVKNLYLNGQDVATVGIEGATLSGCFTASRVLSRFVVFLFFALLLLQPLITLLTAPSLLIIFRK